MPIDFVDFIKNKIPCIVVEVKAILYPNLQDFLYIFNKASAELILGLLLEYREDRDLSINFKKDIKIP